MVGGEFLPGGFVFLRIFNQSTEWPTKYPSHTLLYKICYHQLIFHRYRISEKWYIHKTPLFIRWLLFCFLFMLNLHLLSFIPHRQCYTSSRLENVEMVVMNCVQRRIKWNYSMWLILRREFGFFFPQNSINKKFERITNNGS